MCLNYYGTCEHSNNFGSHFISILLKMGSFKRFSKCSILWGLPQIEEEFLHYFCFYFQNCCPRISAFGCSISNNWYVLMYEAIAFRASSFSMVHRIILPTTMQNLHYRTLYMAMTASFYVKSWLGTCNFKKINTYCMKKCFSHGTVTNYEL